MSALLGGVADSVPLAGGMTLLPTIKQRLAAPTALIDLSQIPQLTGISAQGDILTLGAMTRHVDVAESELVRRKMPLLASLAAGIGDPAVRNRGTIGGSVANNDPSADYPAAVLALDATIVTDRREIAADAFFRGLFETALEPGEIITALRFPMPSAGSYAKFKSPASRYAVVGVCVAKRAGKVRVAVTGAGPGVFRVGAMEAALERAFTPDAIAAIRPGSENLSSDIHADAEYRAHLVTVMAKKAVISALQTR
jgi:carbon-monoxide dehydrogenase medium subunit